MNSHPLVSVIVPVYNVEQYLEECVKSILSQTYKNLEIILVDDGATDSSGRMCDSYAADDGRIKVVHKENGGVSRARNTGIEKSKGEYVLFVDADDYLAPKAIAVLVAQANAVAGVDMVIGDYAAHHSLGYEEEALQRNLPVRQSFTFRESNSDAAYSLLTMVNATFCKLIKKDILIAHDISFPENLKIAEDLVFVVKVLLATTKLAYVDEVLYYYRVDFDNNTSAMGKVSDEKAYDFGKALKIVDTLILDGRCGDSIKAALRKSAVAHSMYALELSEKNKAVHKKVFNYIHKDLFPYFHITEKDISSDDGTQLVLDGDYAGYIMWRLVAVKRYLHTRLDAVGYLEAEVAKKNAKIEELEGEIQYLKSVRGMIRTPLGQIYRRAKRLLRK